MTEENPNAGQGPVVIDIGGDVGALIVLMPHSLVGQEVEIVPTGTADSYRTAHSDAHGHEHGGHQHGHEHGGHEHGGDADHDHPHPPHVAVVVRPLPNGTSVPSLVFGALQQGRYDLYLRPDGPVRLTVDVHGAQVTQADWPDG